MIVVRNCRSPCLLRWQPNNPTSCPCHHEHMLLKTAFLAAEGEHSSDVCVPLVAALACMAARLTTWAHPAKCCHLCSGFPLLLKRKVTFDAMATAGVGGLPGCWWRPTPTPTPDLHIWGFCGGGIGLWRMVAAGAVPSSRCWSECSSLVEDSVPR